MLSTSNETQWRFGWGGRSHAIATSIIDRADNESNTQNLSSFRFCKDARLCPSLRVFPEEMKEES